MKNFSITRDKAKYAGVNEVNSFAGRVYSFIDYAMLYNPDWAEKDVSFTDANNTRTYNINELSYRQYIDINGSGISYMTVDNGNHKVEVSPGTRVINNYRVDEGGIDNSSNTKKELSHYLITSMAPAGAYQYQPNTELPSQTFFIDYYNTLVAPQTFSVSLAPLRYCYTGAPAIGANSCYLNSSRNKVSIMAKIGNAEGSKKERFSAWTGEWPIMVTIINESKDSNGYTVQDELVFENKQTMASHAVSGDAIFGSLTVPAYILSWDKDNKISSVLSSGLKPDQKTIKVIVI